MGFGQDVLAIIMVVLLVIVIGYTIYGGMLTVVITDFMQFTIIAKRYN
jgi:Na+/proline symporter